MKRIISIITALCIVLTPVFSVSAGETESAALEKAILAVKNVVSIPTEYTDFSHYSYETENAYGEGTVYSLYWNDPDDGSSISASVDWNNNVISFYQYDSESSNSSGLAKVTRAKGLETAKAFVKKMYPTLAPNLEEINHEQNLSYTYEHYYQFGLSVNGVSAPFLTVSVNLNKFTGKISSFNGFQEGFVSPAFPSAVPAIDQPTATAAFLENLGFSLSYHSYYDWETQELHVFPAYQLNQTNQYIDAQTGEPVTQYFGGYYYPMATADSAKYSEMAMGMGSEYGGELSEEEIAEIVKLRDLLSKSEAIAKVKAQAPAGYSITYTPDYASLNEQYSDPGSYLWNLSFSNAYATVDASTGDLLSFSCYEETKGNKNLTVEKSKTIAETYLKKVAAAKFAGSEFSETNTDYSVYTDQPDTYGFSYNRVENGIPYPDNSLYIEVNRKTGYVQYFYTNWYKNATFPTIGDTMAEDALMTKVDEVADYGLLYLQTGSEGEVRLVYGFTGTLESTLYDPQTGAALDWMGEIYVPTTRPEYTDIAGHFSESAVNILLENNYYLGTGDKFYPDQKITQLSFFRYLYCNEFAYLNDEELYDNLINMNILEESEAAPKSNLTRQEAAKFAVRYLGLRVAGEHPEIFKALYKDKVTSGYEGYAALVSGLNIMKGDTKGYFNGTKQMTNGEAAVVICQLLKVER